MQKAIQINRAARGAARRQYRGREQEAIQINRIAKGGSAATIQRAGAAGYTNKKGRQRGKHGDNTESRGKRLYK